MNWNKHQSDDNQHHRAPAAGGSALVDCDQVRALIPAYSIGATDSTEAALVEQGLVDCPETAVELAEYMALADAMLYTVVEDDAYAPAAQTATHAPASYATNPYRPATQPTSPMPVYVVNPEQGPARRIGAWAGRLSLAAAALILIVLNGLVFWQINDLRGEQRQLSARLEQQSNTIVLAGQGELHHRQLQVTDAGQSGAQAVIVWDASQEIGSLVVSGFAQLADDMTYQLWLVSEGVTISLGVFQVDADGNGALLFQSPVPIESFEVFGISPEPLDGSPEPTNPHVVIGEV